MPDDLDSLLEIKSQPDATVATEAASPVSAGDTATRLKVETAARKFSWAPFALILICFFLPFFEVSCQGQHVISITGMQLAFGSEIQQPQMFGPPQTQKIPGDTLVLFTLLVAAGALGASFVKGKVGSLLPAIAAALGFILMLVSKMRIDNDVLKQGGGMLTVNYGAGAVAVFLLFLLAAVGNSYLYSRQKKSPPS